MCWALTPRCSSPSNFLTEPNTSLFTIIKARHYLDGFLFKTFIFIFHPDTWLFLCAGGAHVGKHSPQPHDLPHSPTHSASPGCTQRTPQHRPDPARGWNGRQLCGKKKNSVFLFFISLQGLLAQIKVAFIWFKKIIQPFHFPFLSRQTVFLSTKLDLKNS